MNIVDSAYRINTDYGLKANALAAFYRKGFGETSEETSKALVWLHKLENLDRYGPHVTWFNDEIVGTWSAIPEKLVIGDSLQDAAWTLNLFVLPSHRGKGLAEAMLDAQKQYQIPLMGISANGASLSIYLKKGFKQVDIYGSSTFVYLKPFSEGKFAFLKKAGLDNMLNGLYGLWSGLRLSSKKIYHFKPLQEAGNMVTELKKAMEEEQHNDQRIRVKRGDAYFGHRVLNSPHVSDYFIYQKEGFIALIYMKQNISAFFVLWVSNTADTNSYTTLIGDLYYEGRKRKLRGMGFFTSNHKVPAALKGKFIASTKTPLSIIWHPDEKFLAELMDSPWDVQVIDTDLEGFIN